MLKASWRVLAGDKELMAIPVLSFLATVSVAALTGGGIFVSLAHDTAVAAGQSEYRATPLTYAVGVIGYLAITFVVTFFAAALVAGARERLLGGNPSLGSAFATAGSRVGAIALWSLVAGTVGLVLNAIQERSGILGAAVARLVGMAWQIVTWLVVPVIVVEGTGPVTSLKRSAHLFSQTWGENLIGQIGFGLVGSVLVIPGLLIAVLLGLALPLLGIAVGIVWIAVASVVLSTLSGIYRTVLYHFAAGEPIPAEFDRAELAGAFRSRTTAAA
jgi:hypothetical protein